MLGSNLSAETGDEDMGQGFLLCPFTNMFLSIKRKIPGVWGLTPIIIRQRDL